MKVRPPKTFGIHSLLELFFGEQRGFLESKIALERVDLS